MKQWVLVQRGTPSGNESGNNVEQVACEGLLHPGQINKKGSRAFREIDTKHKATLFAVIWQGIQMREQSCLPETFTLSCAVARSLHECPSHAVYLTLRISSCHSVLHIDYSCKIGVTLTYWHVGNGKSSKLRLVAVEGMYITLDVTQS